MPTAFEAMIAAADIETPVPDTSTAPAPTSETSTAGTPNDTTPPAADTSTAPTADTPPASTAPAAEGQPATPATPPGTSDAEKSSRALIEEAIAAHPEHEAALTAKVRELERGYQKKYEALAAMRKEAAEGVMRDSVVSDIPVPHLNTLAQLYRMMEHGNAQQRQQAADQLFYLSEATRQAAATTPADPYANLDPRVQGELAQVRAYVQQQQYEQTLTAINHEFTQLEAEFGSIPEDQKIQVMQAMQDRGLREITDIPLVYKGLYGWQHAQKQAKTAALQQQKAGLAPTTTPIAPPPAASGAKKSSMWDDIDSICAEYGVK